MIVHQNGRRVQDVPAEDRAWWAAGGVDYYAEEPDWDRLAAEFEAQDRLERGLHPDDVAAIWGYRDQDDHGDTERRGCWGGHEDA